jgi:hypothetical protein
MCPDVPVLDASAILPVLTTGMDELNEAELVATHAR